MSVTNNVANVVSQLQGDISRNLEKAAIFFKTKVKEKLNQTGSPQRSKTARGVYIRNQFPSSPGEAPRKESGTLQRSISHKMSADRQAAYVGSNIDYAGFLELGTRKAAPRPFLQTTLLENRDAIVRIVATGSR